jgi:hypothetical protein
MVRQHQRGAARLEAIVILACFGVFFAIGSLVLGQTENPKDQSSFKAHAKTQKDASQLRGIHQSWLVFSREFNGTFPTPGLIDRLPFNGVETPGRGDEDKTANTTANLFSVCVMYNYFTPEFIISPIERNPKMKIAADYNYEVYDPVNDRYWDAKFKADLATGSHVSYAHMPIYGQWQLKQWRDTANDSWPILGNRGPKDGAADPSSYTCGPHGNWAGNMVFNGGNNRFFFLEPAVPTQDGAIDNFFATPDVNSGDAFITFTGEIKDDGPVFQFD